MVLYNFNNDNNHKMKENELHDDKKIHIYDGL